MESADDRPLHALNHYYGRGFLAAFGYRDVERYEPKARSSKAASLDQLRKGNDDGKRIRALPEVTK